MAKIRNSIDLADRMSPALKAVMKALDSTLKVMEQVDRATKTADMGKAYRQAEEDVRRANNELIRMQNYAAMAGQAAARGAASANDGMSRYEKTVGRVINRLNKMSTSFNKMSGLGTFMSQQGIISYNPMKTMFGNFLNTLGNRGSQLTTNLAAGVGAAGTKLGGVLNRVKEAFNQATDSASKTSTSISGIVTGLASAVYLAKNLATALTGVMETADQTRSYTARIGLFNYSDMSDDDVYGKVFQIAMGTRSDLDETANLVYKLLMSGAFGETEDSTGQALGMASLINKALVAGGGTAEENARALLQLNQGLASGYLQGDELRSIREQAPYLARMLAEGLGKIDDKFIGTTIGDLKELGAQGELTTDRIVRALAAMSPEINEAFGKMPRTFGQAMTQLSSIWEYFLSLLYQGEGPLAVINEQIWQFIDYISSPAGLENLEMIAAAIGVIVQVILALASVVGAVWSFMIDNIDLLKAAFMALAIIMVVCAIAAIVQWIALHWRLLLIIAVLTAIISIIQAFGVTTGDVLGFIAGGIAALFAIIWDIIIFIIQLFGNLVLAVVHGWLWIRMQGQTLFAYIGMGWDKLCAAISSGAEGFGYAVQSVFTHIADVALSVAQAVASAWDWVFGTSYADSIAGMRSRAWDALEARAEAAGLSDKFAEIEVEYSAKLDSIQAEYDAGLANIDSWNNMMDNAYMDIGAAYDFGYNIGNNIGNALDNLSAMDLSAIGDNIGGATGLGDLESMLSDGIPVNGGDVDSVGKVKSDVDISDEDLKLLRDMAAREFLLNLTSITPQANITFGDVRETADVGQIMEVLEEMVEEQMATALVEG